MFLRQPLTFMGNPITSRGDFNESSMDTIAALDSKNKEVQIQITEDLIKTVAKEVRKAGTLNNKFDLCLTDGKVAENLLAKILNDSTIEVKKDSRVSQTLNLAIEYIARNKPSGISVSSAKWWALCLSGDKFNDEIIVLITKDRLLRLLQGCRIVKGGDLDGGTKGVAEMFLLPLSKLLSPLEGAS